MELTSKQRAYLFGLSHELSPVIQIGKNGVAPESVEAAEEAFSNRELIKGTVLKTAPDEVRTSAEMLAERTHAQVVRVIGRKFVLYRAFKKDPEIVLPR